MRISILTIGDELLIGQVLNSNVQWMSSELTDLGLSVAAQLSVGDVKTEIHSALDFLMNSSEAIIIGGGLGPTHDDLTMEVLSEYFSIPLEFDADWIAKVEAFFRARNRVMSENNKKQGYLLKNATRIDNDCGTAAGQHFVCDDKHLFVVPGVPHEMKSMMERYILPTLRQKLGPNHQKILKKTLITTGMGESALAERADTFVKKVKSLPHVTLAFLPSPTLVKLRLQMKSKNEADEALFEQLVHELKNYCGKDFIGYEPATLEALVIDHLKNEGKTLALAESCTGGLLAHRLTQIPGASPVLKGSIVAYQNEVKQAELGISDEFLKLNGVVSEATAKAMAEAIRKKWNTDYAIATTGYLGPSGGDSFASVGTVCVAVASTAKTLARTFQFENNRERAKERAAQTALDLLRRNF